MDPKLSIGGRTGIYGVPGTLRWEAAAISSLSVFSKHSQSSGEHRHA